MAQSLPLTRRELKLKEGGDLSTVTQPLGGADCVSVNSALLGFLPRDFAVRTTRSMWFDGIWGSRQAQKEVRAM